MIQREFEMQQETRKELQGKPHKCYQVIFQQKRCIPEGTDMVDLGAEQKTSAVTSTLSRKAVI